MILDLELMLLEYLSRKYGIEDFIGYAVSTELTAAGVKYYEVHVQLLDEEE